MTLKTKIDATSGRQDLVITREFELPLALLFRAYEEPELVEQWMGTKVLKLENRQHGAWRYETRAAGGNVVFSAHGVIHEFDPGKRIIRTFQMENTPFPPQLEFLEFEALSENTSKLTMQIIYRSAEFRDQMLQLPFAQGINMAHNKLQETLNILKQ